MNVQRLRWMLATVLVAALVSCQASDEEAVTDVAPEAPAPTAEAVVEVIVEDYSFLAPPELRSGWTTLQMTNRGEEPHFLILWRLPEGVEFAEYAEIARLFQGRHERYRAGDLTEGEMVEQIVAALPEWFGQVEGMGGVGLTAPGRTSRSTVLLEPGEYVMECYVMGPEGQFHGTLGMLRPLIVREDSTGMQPPEADVRITLANYEMSIEGELTAGEQTVAVHAVEEAEGLIGHDIHLARLEADTSIEELVAWMDWVDAMIPPAPAEFLGGAEHVSAGRTSFVTVSLEPGRYVWISEGYASAGILHEFVIE